MNLDDLKDFAEGADALMKKHKVSPQEVPYRLAGLGAAEQEAGVPKWAWFGMGVLAGSAAMFFFGDAIRDKLDL